jgi:hypothetical protein
MSAFNLIKYLTVTVDLCDAGEPCGLSGWDLCVWAIHMPEG